MLKDKINFAICVIFLFHFLYMHDTIPFVGFVRFVKTQLIELFMQTPLRYFW